MKAESANFSTPAGTRREPLMTEAAFAKWVNKSLSTVRLWRRKGIGPRYVKLGERGVGLKWTPSVGPLDPAS